MDTPSTRRELVPVKEAAARLGLSESDVRRRIKAGTLPAEQFDRPQGTYYRVIFETPADALPPTHKPSAMRQDQPATHLDTSTTRLDGSSGIDALAALVTRLTETVERQAATIADLREERGTLQTRVEYTSARADALTAELEALRAENRALLARTAVIASESTPKPPGHRLEPWWRRWLAAAYGW